MTPEHSKILKGNFDVLCSIQYAFENVNLGSDVSSVDFINVQIYSVAPKT